MRVLQRGGAAPRRRILIADDSPATLLWARLLLQDVNVEVLTARDGHATFAMALARRPDLVLLAARMSGGKGLEICRRLRATTALRQTPIILMTVLGTDVGDCLAAGASDVVAKPFDRTTLRTTVARWLSGRGRGHLSVTTMSMERGGERDMGELPRPRPQLEVVRGGTVRRPLRRALARRAQTSSRA
ncbi:MAG: hypothetical protein NVS4B3_15950 [Gemmatimonadaceae bacterium]